MEIVMVYNKTDKVLEKQEMRRKRIIKAAKEILTEEEEIGKVSIKSIAKRAGIATGTFYLYFQDKESLVDMIVKEIYEELLEKIKEERAKYDTNFDKLKASMEVCIRLFMKEKYLAKILLEQFPQLHSAINTKYADIEEDLIRLTKIDLDGPLLCKEDPIEGGPDFKDYRIILSDEPGLGFRKISNIKF